jgi:hypothetical protein
MELDKSQVRQHWSDVMDEKEKKLIQHATDYARLYPDAGVPGQAHYLLIAKMVDILVSFDYAITQAQGKIVKQQVVWSENDQCWRDIITGVRTEIEDRYSRLYEPDTTNSK